MLRRMLRSTLVAGTFAAVTVPSTASAQDLFYTFSSCAAPGVCGTVDAFFTASILTVRVANRDALLGSALYSAQLIFSGALNPGSLGSAFTIGSTAQQDRVTSIGTTPANGWSFSGVGGSSTLDLASFMNVFIEGSAASPYRALPGDPDAGTWVTTQHGFVEFTADLGGVVGANMANISGLGFCTDQDCVSGTALVATPEPATLALCATGFIGLIAIRRRRKAA